MHKKAKAVHESYIRSGGESFVNAFYNHLILSSDAIKEKFSKIDMQEQAAVLSHAIVMAFLFADKNHQQAVACFNKVRESHSRNHLNIEPELYDIWLKCLIDTVAVCDPQSSEELLNDWHAVMSVAIAHIRDGY